MNSDSMKKYSDKLLFTLLSGKDLDEEDLIEIAEKYAQDEQKKETWKVAHEHKDKLKLAAGEYPPLFSQKMKEGEQDKFSENVFYVNELSSADVSHLFIPTPTSLFFGDLLRANPAKNGLPMKDLLENAVGDDKGSSYEMDFSDFREPVEVPNVPVKEVVQETASMEDVKAAFDLLKESVKEKVKEAKDSLELKFNAWLVKKFKL
jgi:hypothetical protein